MRIVALFNLKHGVTIAEYEEWARRVDLPTVNGLPSIARFELFRATGVMGCGAAPPYAYIEILDVDDMGQFGEDVATPAMKAIATTFQEMVDVIFLTTEQIVT